MMQGRRMDLPTLTDQESKNRNCNIRWASVQTNSPKLISVLAERNSHISFQRADEPHKREQGRTWWTGSRWFNMGRKHLVATMRTKLRWFMDRMNKLSLGFSKQNIKRTSSTAALWKWRRRPQTPRRQQSIGRDWIQIWEGLNTYVTGIHLLNFNTCCEWSSLIEDGWSCGGWNWDLGSITLSMFET